MTNVVVAVSVGKEDRTASLMIRDGKPWKNTRIPAICNIDIGLVVEGDDATVEKQYVVCPSGFLRFCGTGREYFQMVIAIGVRCSDSWAAFCVFLGSFSTFGIDVGLRDGDGDPENPWIRWSPWSNRCRSSEHNHVAPQHRSARLQGEVRSAPYHPRFSGNKRQYGTTSCNPGHCPWVFSVYVRQPLRCVTSRIGLGIVPIETVTFPGLSVPVPDRGGLDSKCMKSGALDVFFLSWTHGSDRFGTFRVP